MGLRERHNIHIVGNGKTDMIMAHGYGCDQNMWRLITPAFEKDYRIILYDLMGSGRSELSAYSKTTYASLGGHAKDLIAIASELTRGPAVFVGHSVSAMIGLLAGIASPGAFAAHIMVGPSPRYINDGDYIGGFSRADIDSLLDTIDSNYLGWASAMAPQIMGAPDKPALGEELTNSFCRTDPEIAKHFARVTFTSDNRADLPKLHEPTLLLQCSDDIIAPRTVGDYLHRHIPKSTLKLIDNIGHCPHLSAPDQIIEATLSVSLLTSIADDGANAAFQSAACGLLTLDPKGRIELANALVVHWSGLTLEALIGRSIQDLFTVGSKLFLQTQWWPLLEMQGSIAEVQLELLRTNANEPAAIHPVLMNAARRADRRIDVAIFVATDRRKYERELLLARRRAEELLETVALREAELRVRATFAEQLIGIVSHDLKNPLNAILIGTHLLASTVDGRARDATVKRIANAAERASRLTSELLDFTQARLGSGIPVRRAAIDLYAVVGDAVEELRLAWPAREIVHEHEGTRLVSADADRLAQVVTNLVGNAMAYGTPDRPITVTSVVSEEAARIRVHNAGRPIPTELRETIFEPLRRGEEQVQRGSRSVGLGLYIVREIAHAHGGEARVESSAEHGTTFEVVFGPSTG